MSDYMLSLLVLMTNVSAQSRASKETILAAVPRIQYYKQRKIALYLSPITGPVSLFISPLSAFFSFPCLHMLGHGKSPIRPGVCFNLHLCPVCCCLLYKVLIDIVSGIQEFIYSLLRISNASFFLFALIPTIGHFRVHIEVLDICIKCSVCMVWILVYSLDGTDKLYIDHVLGRPSIKSRKIQVLVVFSFWILYLSKYAPFPLISIKLAANMKQRK